MRIIDKLFLIMEVSNTAPGRLTQNMNLTYVFTLFYTNFSLDATLFYTNFAFFRLGVLIATSIKIKDGTTM